MELAGQRVPDVVEALERGELPAQEWKDSIKGLVAEARDRATVVGSEVTSEAAEVGK